MSTATRQRQKLIFWLILPSDMRQNYSVTCTAIRRLFSPRLDPPAPSDPYAAGTVSTSSVAISSRAEGAADQQGQNDVVALAPHRRAIRDGEQFPGLLFREPVSRRPGPNRAPSGAAPPLGWSKAKERYAWGQQGQIRAASLPC